jgi:hypothetical protein
MFGAATPSHWLGWDGGALWLARSLPTPRSWVDGGGVGVSFSWECDSDWCQATLGAIAPHWDEYYSFCRIALGVANWLECGTKVSTLTKKAL